ncbi:MAG: NAD(P)-dependent alcohol dehydrogenase [Bacteroidota bacterium]
MKAIVCTRYGAPDVLHLQDVPKPTPGDFEVLIRVKAAVVNHPDLVFRMGTPWISRLVIGLTKPKHAIPGDSFAGIVEAVGKKVSLFQPGDEIFGATGTEFGAHAEYLCLPESAAMTPKPQNMSFGEAVSVCYGGLTALPFLRDVGKIKAGQKVLINGASGGIGTYAVQMAKAYGAHVTAVCSGKNAAWVKELGADRVIDYQQMDYTQEDVAYDIIFDTVAKSKFAKARRVLSAQGTFMTPGIPASIFPWIIWTSIFRGGKKARFAATGLRPTKDRLVDLKFMREWIEAGKMTSVIDREYSLAEVPEAHRYVATERKKGNVVIRI